MDLVLRLKENSRTISHKYEIKSFLFVFEEETDLPDYSITGSSERKWPRQARPKLFAEPLTEVTPFKETEIIILPNINLIINCSLLCFSWNDFIR